MTAALAGLHVMHARAKGFGQDRLRAQLAVHRLAAEVDADRLLGPAAILVVRRAVLRLPRWREIDVETAFDATLRPLLARAGRAASGFVPADAEAVLFADEAELLACLARALVDGSLAGQWWWAALRIGAPRHRMVAQAWRERPQAIAAALAALDRSGQAAAFVRALGPAAAADLARAMIAAHGLSRLVGLPDAASGAAPCGRHDSAPGPQHAAAGSMPWDALALHPATLALPQPLQWPIVLAASLRRAPTMARGEAFAAAVREWLAPPVDGGSGQAGETPRSPPRADHPARSFRPDAPIARGLGDRPPGPRPASREILEAQTAPRTAIATIFSAPASDIATSDPITDPAMTPDIEATSRAPSDSEPAASCELHTRFGGLLFLLNLGLAQELWGDFTRPRHDDFDVSPWTWLGAIGDGLCGPDFGDDPLRALLREMAADDAAAGDPQAWPFPPALLAGRRRDPFAAHLAWLRGCLLDAFGRRRFAVLRRRLLLRPARVQVGTVRLDAIFAIADHPVQIRAAGLDRDPGWIPAAGRDVRFHFR